MKENRGEQLAQIKAQLAEEQKGLDELEATTGQELAGMEQELKEIGAQLKLKKARGAVKDLLAKKAADRASIEKENPNYDPEAIVEPKPIENENWRNEQEEIEPEIETLPPVNEEEARSFFKHAREEMTHLEAQVATKAEKEPETQKEIPKPRFIPTPARSIEEIKPVKETKKEDSHDPKTIVEPEPIENEEWRREQEKIKQEKGKSREQKSPMEEVADFITEFKLESVLPLEFTNLSAEQKFSVIQNLKQRILDMVKQDATTQYSQDLKEKNIFASIRARINKNYNLKEFEQKALAEFKATENKQFITDELMQLTQAIKRREVVINAEGKPNILYISLDDHNVSPELIANFNTVANNFRNIPYEWGQEKNGKHKEEYDKAKTEYEKVRNLILSAKSSREGKEKATTEMLQLDNILQFDQLLNTHPEFEKELNTITNSSTGREQLKDVLGFLSTLQGGKGAERTLLFAGGYGARMLARGAALASGMTGITFIPVAAISGIIGGLRGRMRGKQTLEERKKLARKGAKFSTEKEDKKGNIVGSENVATFDAEQLAQKLRREIDSLISEADITKQDKALASLSARIEYTQTKIESGEVSFGDAKTSLTKQYALISALNEALVEKQLRDPATNTDLIQRLNKFSAGASQRLTTRQKEFVNKQMLKGAAWGTGAATAGYLVRWLGETQGWWGNAGVVSSEQTGIPSGSVEDIKGELNLDAQHQETLDQMQADAEAREAAQAQADSAEARELRVMQARADSLTNVPDSGIVTPGASRAGVFATEGGSAVAPANTATVRLGGFGESPAETPATGATVVERAAPVGDTTGADTTTTPRISKLAGFTTETDTPAAPGASKLAGFTPEETGSGAASSSATPDVPPSVEAPSASATPSEVEEYIKAHPEATHEVHRSWYDNNTEQFDKNELRTHWGGENGTGINTEGKYILDVSKMTSDGSVQGNLSANAQELLKGGKLKFLISATSGTQDQVFELPIDANGQIVVDPNTEIGKMFFKTVNGHAVFTGRFGEIAEKLDDNNNFRVLSTIEGSHPQIETGIPQAPNPIPTPEHVENTITPATPESEIETKPPIAPIEEITKPPAPPTEPVKPQGPSPEEQIDRIKRNINDILTKNTPTTPPEGTEEMMEHAGPYNYVGDQRAPIYDQYAYQRSAGYNQGYNNTAPIHDQYAGPGRSGGENLVGRQEVEVEDTFKEPRGRGERPTMGNRGFDNSKEVEDAFTENTPGGKNTKFDNSKEVGDIFKDQKLGEANRGFDNTTEVGDPWAFQKIEDLNLPDQLQDNVFDLRPNELGEIYRVHERVIPGIAPDNIVRGGGSIDNWWSQIKNLSARKILEKPSADQAHLADYLKRLTRVTGLQPAGGGLFNFQQEQTVDNFIYHALQKATEMGRLSELR